MSTSVSNQPARTDSKGSEGLTHGQLNPPVLYAIVAGALLLAALTFFGLGWEFNVMGVFGFVMLAALLYAVVVYVTSRVVEGPRQAADRLTTAIVTMFFLLAVIPLISLIWTVVEQGVARFDVTFFTEDMTGVLGEGGGAMHAIVGTLIITLLSTLISVPIGILAAIYLVEYASGNRLARALTFFVDVMTGIPSIVAGLFAVSLFTMILGPQFRLGIIGAVALCVLMIPIVVRNTEEMLRVVPNELREAAYALGVPKWLTIVKVVLRTAIAGIATGVTISIARIIGETAPLLITVGLTNATNWNPFQGRMATLPVFSYYQYATPGVPPEPYIERAWTAALVLMIIVMGLNLLARWISHQFAPKAR